MGLVWLLSTAKRERLMATSTTTQTRGLQQQLECRPWLALYGVRLQVLPKALTEEEQAELALIQRVFPEELLTTIFSFLGAYTLGRAACVCQQWRQLAEHPKHWQAACADAFGPCHKDVRPCQELVRQQHRGSWKRLFLATPHVRFEGLYVSRNTYIRQGAAELRRSATCHLVTYYRYFRFFPDGSLLYRTSPNTVARVAKSLQPARPQQQQQPASTSSCTGGGSVRPPTVAPAAKYEQHVQAGRYVIKGGKLYLIIVYPNSRSTEVRARCGLRGVPHLAAANRLDLEELASFDRDSGSSSSMLADPDADPSGAGSVTSFRRGLSSAVFVPWEEVASSPLNLHSRDMDFWLPG